MNKDALMSADGTYRWSLWRDWSEPGNADSENAGICCFIMLNPSTADALIDDPTIRRCIGFAKKLDCTKLEVVNLFALRSTKPEALYTHHNPIGTYNDIHIRDAIRFAKLVICAWGNLGSYMERDKAVLKMIRDMGKSPMTLKVNASSGMPGHPLYLSKDLVPVELAA